MIYTTKYTDKDGITWMKDEDRINAICLADAEQQAEKLGLTVVGRLIEEHILDDEGNTIEIINHENIQNN